jgi:hypothetical protein
MGECSFCGKSAGFLKNKHKECAQAHESGKDQMVNLVSSSIFGELIPKVLDENLSKIAGSSFIDTSAIHNILVEGWELAVANALEDGILSEEEEKCLEDFTEHYSLGQSDLDERGAYTLVAKAGVLRDLIEGKIPERMTVEGNLPFNFQKKEKLIWVFKDVDYYEQRTKREYVGGYHGVGLRVAKGVYYRVGAFKGRPVDRTETVNADCGLLGVTNKHIYFSGSQESFRVKLDKIVTFTPSSDGITIQRDAASAKPQSFVTGEGWFIYNLVSNASQLE